MNHGGGGDCTGSDINTLDWEKIELIVSSCCLNQSMDHTQNLSWNQIRPVETILDLISVEKYNRPPRLDHHQKHVCSHGLAFASSELAEWRLKVPTRIWMNCWQIVPLLKPLTLLTRTRRGEWWQRGGRRGCCPTRFHLRAKCFRNACSFLLSASCS